MEREGVCDKGENEHFNATFETCTRIKVDINLEIDSFEVES